VGFDAIYGRDPVTDEILGIGGRRGKTVWKFDDLLDVSYELDLFGHVRRSIEASKADTQATAAARDAVKVTVAAETTRAYVSICVLGEQLAVARQSLQVVTRQLEIAARSRAAGAATDFDVVRAQVIASQVRATIPPLEGQRRAALLELTALIGKTPAYAPQEALACVAPPRLQASIPVGDGAGLLRRRPDIREAERRLAADTARVGVATAELYPQINLVGSYGGVSGDISALTLERGLTWGVGPSISWYFPNQAAPRARVRASKADAAAALQAFDSTVLAALKETEQALAAYGSELDSRQALEDAQRQAHQAFRLAQGQVADGSASALDLLTSEQQMVAADAALASSDGALVSDQVGVFKALGGGWQGTRLAANSP
jgi:NodT family efflux transporter outer membrane factor (OMF) lipoprotein